MPSINALRINFALVLVLLTVCQVSVSLRCPIRSSSEKDTYNVQGRLDKVLKDLGYVFGIYRAFHLACTF